MNDNNIYFIRLIILIAITILFRLLLDLTNELFYDYVSYISSISFILLILFPKLENIKIFGIEARSKIVDDREDIEVVKFK